MANATHPLAAGRKRFFLRRPGVGATHAPDRKLPLRRWIGADFLCVGMFDFQVDEDAGIMREVLAAQVQRTRPWA
jgi:hypothetical protein